jgi:CheY-like chemotaxis protein
MHKTPLFFLIDDDFDDQEIFLLSLHDIDPKIKSVMAKDGCDALEIIAKNKDFVPDFVFLDLNMPRLTGHECLVQLRQIPRFQNIPIYVYSTSSSNKEREVALAHGATGFITKPSSIKGLVKILSDLIVVGGR